MKFTADPTQDKASTFPDGDYFLTCTDVQSMDKYGKPLRSKKNGYDQYILEMTVSDGPYKNRKLWHYLTFIPAVPGVNNGHGMALRCLHAFGLPYEGEIVVEPDMFIDVTVRAKVAVEQNDAQYDPKNVIKKFYVVDDDSNRLPPPPPAETGTPKWVDEGTADGSRRAQAEKTAPTPMPAQAVRAKAPWRR